MLSYVSFWGMVFWLGIFAGLFFGEKRFCGIFKELGILF